LVIADQYLDMSYQWVARVTGGRKAYGGLLRFVINVYKEACLASGASLPFSDTTSWMLHDAYTIPVTTPRAGRPDLHGNGGNRLPTSPCSDSSPLTTRSH
jgi:hypothetical protein